MSPDQIEMAIRDAMPQTVDELSQLVAIPSVAYPGHPAEPVHAAADQVETLLRGVGLAEVRQIPIEGSYPAIYGTAPAPPGAPTVLLYAHYDVQPAGDSEKWETSPFEPLIKDGRMYGRGAADDKSGIVAHVAALRAFSGKFPIGVKVIVEGQEEYAGERLEEFVRANPDLFRADAVVVADSGNPKAGDPAITTSLRGITEFTVEVRTLESALHSGQFGGVAPDALTALMRMLSSLFNETGEAAVPGLPRGTWLGTSPSEEEFRATAGVLDDVSLVGNGSVADRLWSSYSITVTGMDVPSVQNAINAVQPVARARVTVRVPPSGDPEATARAVIDHLERVTPWGARVSFHDRMVGSGFMADSGGALRSAMHRAMEKAFGRPPRDRGAGGSIPLVSTLAHLYPAAEIFVCGALDGESSVHAPNERVDLEELRRVALTEALFMNDLAPAGDPLST